MQIIVASTNPVKIEAARCGFAQVFPDESLAISGVNVPSGVSNQPMTDAETLRGARNRATNARIAHPEADYSIGIEGGVEDAEGVLVVFAWVVVLGQGKAGRSRTATFVLPDEVAQLVHQGMELGDADDVVFGRSNSKQQNGSIGILTHDRIDRTAYYAHAIVMALIPFLNPELSFPE